jgi:hypothetical protein
MKVVMRLKPLVLALCLSTLAFAEIRISSQAPEERVPPMCEVNEPREMTWEYRWRWYAHQHLSCVIDTLEQAMNRPGNIGNDSVTLPRQEVEQLLKLAWAARDSAQRIGR